MLTGIASGGTVVRALNMYSAVVIFVLDIFSSTVSTLIDFSTVQTAQFSEAL
jgi:hypothetical protein